MVLNKIKKILLILIFSCVFGTLQSHAIIWDNPKDIAVYIPQGNDKTSMMKKAFEEWQKKTQNRFIFRFVNSEYDADINVVFVEKNLEQFCGNKEAMGCSLPSFYKNMPRETIYITKRRPKGLLLSNTQIYAIMRHEIGHAIGLKHSNDFNEIMYPITNLGIAIRQDIRKNDLKQLYRVYGINPR